MKVRVPDYYNSFSCLGSECPDTCCVGWLIEIDDESYERFKKLSGPTGDKIRENIFISDEGKPCFKLNEGGRCAFLNEQNLCQMYIDLGEECQSALCANYPRIGDEFGSLREMGLSVSCPEVARILLSHREPIGYEEWDVDDTVMGTDYCKDPVFELILELREVAVMIAQNRMYSISQRLGILVAFAARMQGAVDDNDYKELDNIIDDYSDEGYISKIAAVVNCEGKRDNLLKNIYPFMEKLDYISPSWVKLLEKAMNSEKGNTRCEDYCYENWMVYLILRYFLKVIFDGEVYSRFAFMVFSISVIEAVISHTEGSFNNIVEVFYLFSKEIEHCDENMELLNDWFWDEPWNNPQNII